MSSRSRRTAPALPTAGVSASVRQIDALCAGMTLLDRIGRALDATGVRTSLIVSDIAGRSDLDVALYPAGGGVEDTPAVLDGICAAAAELELPLAVAFDFPNSLSLEVRTTFAGIRVRVYAHFTSPDGIAAARALTTPAVSA